MRNKKFKLGNSGKKQIFSQAEITKNKKFTQVLWGNFMSDVVEKKTKLKAHLEISTIFKRPLNIEVLFEINKFQE